VNGTNQNLIGGGKKMKKLPSKCPGVKCDYWGWMEDPTRGWGNNYGTQCYRVSIDRCAHDCKLNPDYKNMFKPKSRKKVAIPTITTVRG
jgi:hypothetical protein